MSKSIFISTTIPYVNARPHIGFALELIQADVAARFARLCGENVFFQSGSDENSLKNVEAAAAAGRETREHVDENTRAFRELGEKLGVSLDAFVRTSSSEHHAAVTDFWSRLKAEDIYERNYEGAYCVGCEEFLQSADLEKGKCVDHGTKPNQIHERNLFFALSTYEARLAELITSDRLLITPHFKKSEILNFIADGLDDISVTRPKERAGGWGIAVPGRPEDVVYVWIDALINYANHSAWSAAERRTHFVGKNVWKFHAIYWPALLLSAGLPLPDEIVIHGFLTENGRKISKSNGGAFDPAVLVDEVGADSVRFALLRGFSPFDDGDFSLDRLREIHNSYLVNGLGNLASRLLTLADRAGVKPVVQNEEKRQEQSSTPRPELRPSLRPELRAKIRESRFDEALKILWQDVDRINAEIAKSRPWEKPVGYEIEISRWLEELADFNFWLGAFLPSTSEILGAHLKGVVDRTHLFHRIDEKFALGVS